MRRLAAPRRCGQCSPGVRGRWPGVDYRRGVRPGAEGADFVQGHGVDAGTAAIRGRIVSRSARSAAIPGRCRPRLFDAGPVGATLSGGESQRIRLASQIGSGLTGVLYVLDEPTIGLHPRDNRRLLGALQHLRNLGNTPSWWNTTAKSLGRPITCSTSARGRRSRRRDHGTRHAQAGAASKVSLTGQYLSGKKFIPIPTNRRLYRRRAARRCCMPSPISRATF